MSDRAFELFDEYAAAYARGERPDAEAYLAQAGDERTALASLLDDFIRRAPVGAPTEDDQRMLGVMLAGEPPLLALRVELGLRVDEVVDRLLAELALEPATRTKVKRYYQRLEGGLLDPRGLSSRVRRALVQVLGEGAEAAMEWLAPRPPAPAVPAYRRMAAPAELAAPAAAAAGEPPDEVDRLFTGGVQKTGRRSSRHR